MAVGQSQSSAFYVAAQAGAGRRKWWTLAAVTASLFMVMVDTTIVNVALPAIQTDLKISLSQLEWTVNAFLLVYAALLLTGGKLADFIGRRRMFLFGLLVFTIASLACGLAPDGATLIAARAFQGIGAALMLPATQGLIAANFEPHERGMAFGIWAGVSTLGLSLGPLVGGLLVDGLDWRWIFYVNIPFGAAAFLFAWAVIRESRDTSRGQRLDVPGLLTSGLTLFALVFGLVEANKYGWTSWQILLAFVVSWLSFGIFIMIESSQRAPMVDLSLFRNSTFTGANVTALLIMLALFGVLFFVSLYLQAVLGYSAVRAGATFLPMTVLLMLVAPPAGKLADRFGAQFPIAFGLALLSVALILLSQLDTRSTFWDMLPGLVVAGIGVGLAMAPTTTTAIGSVPVDKAGIGSGVVNTFRQTGGALGIAIMGAILAANLDGATPGTREFAQNFVPGFQDALLLGAFISLAGSVVGMLMIRKVRTEEVYDVGA